MLTIEDYLSLFTSSMRAKPRFMALAVAVLSQVDDLLTLVLTDFPAAYNLETAAGSQLDTLGVLLNAPRPTTDTTDDDYRLFLRARIAAYHWNGMNETLPALLESVFPGMNAKLIDNLNGSVTASPASKIPFDLKDVFPCPAGIQMKTSG